MESHSISSEFVIIRAGGCILSVRKNEFTQGAKKKKGCRENILLESFLYFINRYLMINCVILNKFLETYYPPHYNFICSY